MKKKITIELNQFKKLGRMCDFGLANQDRFKAGAPAAEALLTITTTVSSLKELTASQASAQNRLRELRHSRVAARAALYSEVGCIYHTARAVAAETPGFDEKFKLSLKTEAKLLTAARSALQDAAPAAGIFVSHAMPSDFLDRLDAVIRNLESAREEHEKQKTACATGAAELKASLEKALVAASRFDAIVRNTLRGDTVILTEWERICRTPRLSHTKPTAEPTPPQPQVESV